MDLKQYRPELRGFMHFLNFLFSRIFVFKLIFTSRKVILFFKTARLEFWTFFKSIGAYTIEIVSLKRPVLRKSP